MSQWTEWGTCSPSCGEGTSSRKRTLLDVKPQEGRCQTNEARSCNQAPCYVKEAWCLRLRDNGQLAEAPCAWASYPSCKRSHGCPASHVYYTCKSNSRGTRGDDEYLLLCATVNNNRCAVHSEATDFICEQCCISDDCGSRMRRCSSSAGNQWFPLWSIVSVLKNNWI